MILEKIENTDVITQLYEAAFEEAHYGILLLDADNAEVIAANGYARSLLSGGADLASRKISELPLFRDLDISNHLMRTLERVPHIQCADILVSSAEGTRVLEISFRKYLVDPVRVIHCEMRDVTERKRREIASRARLREEISAASMAALPVRVETAVAVEPPHEVEDVRVTVAAGDILVLEQDEGLRKVIRNLLGRKGFTVAEAATEAEAGAVLKGARPKLIVADIESFGPSGVRLAQQIAGMRPAVKTVYVLDESSVVSLPAEAAVIQKPFRLETLLAKIREVLGE
jgi:CheY-like chemotaxis protein